MKNSKYETAESIKSEISAEKERYNLATAAKHSVAALNSYFAGLRCPITISIRFDDSHPEWQEYAKFFATSEDHQENDNDL